MSEYHMHMGHIHKGYRHYYTHIWQSRQDYQGIYIYIYMYVDRL